MKPSYTLTLSARVLLSLTLLLVCPLLLVAQSKDKKTTQPPQSAPAPATTQKPTPPPQQHPVQQQTLQYPPTAGAHPPTAGAHPPTAGTHPPTAGTHPPTAGTHPPTAGTHPPTTGAHPPTPTTIVRSDGGKTVTTPTGNKLAYRPNGKLENLVTKTGTEAHYTPNGHVNTIKTSGGTLITHSPGGVRRVESQRVSTNGEHYRVVSTGPNHGYVQHTFQRGGQEYMRRTYVVNGHTYVNVYSPYSYHGAIYYHYVPAYYYRPAFYGWGYNPWGAPIVYTGWGWYGSPWYTSYGYYFAPYPAYPSAAFWLTDYMIAANLQAAYDSGAFPAGGEGNSNAVPPSSEGQSAQNGSVTLSPEVKGMIAEEVKAQLAAEQAAATQQGTASGASGKSTPQQLVADTDQVPPALDPTLRVFIVATNLNVTADGQSCSLTPGDVLMRTENKEDADHTLGVNIVSSKKSDCSIGSSSRLQVDDLQEMHNHFREQIDTGLKTLAENQGKNGLPSGPAANPRENRDGIAAPDDAAVVTAALKEQQNDAEQAEKEIQQASSPTGGGGNR
jgi:hypothetical protein